MKLKQLKSTVAILSAGAMLMLFGCEGSTTMAPNHQSTAVTATKGLKILKLGDKTARLSKALQVASSVTVANGGELLLEHGVPGGNFVFANQNNPPYHVYRVDLSNPANTVIIGQLGFKSSAIALHPYNGLVYYVADNSVNGVYQVGTWDPATNSNTTLPNGSSFRPAKKLAFAPDGTLYALDVHSSGPDELFTIDTATGAYTLVREYDADISDRGDLTISPDGIMYNINDDTKELQIIDLDTDQVTIVSTINLSDMTGLAFGTDGEMYMAEDNKKMYRISLPSGTATYIGKAVATEIDDIAPVIASTELSYAKVELDILPGAMLADDTLSLSIETTELAGGVAVTFGPHGTNFTVPAILNIEAHGVDFTGVDPNAIDVYYDNQESGFWELMQRDDVIIDVNAGTIKVINAKLPHFSRYAIGGD